VHLHLQVVSQRTHHLLDLLSQLPSGCQHQRLAFQELVVQLLQDAGAKGRRLAGSRLGLLNNIQTLRERNDSALLDRGWLLKT
jgi:hypothetical protein